MSRYISDDENYSIEIDLKPALDDKEFDLRLQKDFMKYSNKNFKNSLDGSSFADQKPSFYLCINSVTTPGFLMTVP